MGNQKLILANQLILFRYIAGVTMEYILLYRKEKPSLVILHPPSATGLRWELENIRGEYKSSLSFKPETINIRWNSLNERNKNGKWTRRSFASGKDHANGYESAFALIRLIFASLAQYFQDLMDTVFKLFSLKVYVSLWIYKKKDYVEMAWSI